MFGRYSERAQRVIVRAQDEARRLGHAQVTTTHLLQGLLRETQGIAAKAVAELGAGAAGLPAEVERVLGRGGAPLTEEIQFTPVAKRVMMERAIEEARGLGHAYVGTEHLLLGLLREADDPAARLLQAAGVALEPARVLVKRLLGSPMQAQVTPSKQTPRPALPHALLRCVGVVLDEQLRVLLVRPDRDAAHWSLPGGAPRAGEAGREAAARHLRDQAGAEATCVDLLWVVERLADAPEGTLRRLDFVFAAGLRGTVPPDRDRRGYFAGDDVPPGVDLPPGFWEAVHAGFGAHDRWVSRHVPLVGF